MQHDKISVIVPIYKMEDYLCKCLDSILAQTYKNLEIILVDDGSPDNCGAICDEYAARDERIIVIHQQNAGVSAARNAALDIATGDYIGFVDSDDWIEPDMYTELLNLLHQYSCDISQCGRMLQPNGLAIFTAPDSPILLSKNSSDPELALLSCEVTNKLFRRELLRSLRFDTAISVGEDMLFIIRVLTYSNTVVLGSRPLYNYLLREGSASRPVPTLESIKRSIEFIPLACELIQDTDTIQMHFISRMLESLLDTCSRLSLNYRPEFSSVRKDIGRFMRSHLPIIKQCRSLQPKDKLKCRLLAHSWLLYRWLLLASKKFTGAK